ncbi:MAG: type II toxin-antitoxin system VapC family toxin [Polyangiaceae bacterium]
MDRVALDTTFLIDVQNERRVRGKARGAIAFLESNRETELLLPCVALGEYLEGFEQPDSNEARALISGIRLLDVNPDVARAYAAAARALRSSGPLIGSNDLWIGCTALAFGVPIVTRNAEHFRRIPKLQVVTYSG